ncbi:hypothetical protein CLIM01_15175 [Colletotrichum limetticola]|uniref:Chromo domain-containing protein n=1 Tax=Colletotrichum limetticola TaxID=1209924 RepID=A0ABQ9P5Z3_9PEZI|nr:hypothetical protein CLIM01_15175 [Colletotrichum limetticola]
MNSTTVGHGSGNTSSTDEWQVKRIQGHSDFDGAIYYHVAWEPTWESEDRLQHMLPVLVAWDRLHGYSDSRRLPPRRYDNTLEHWSGEVAGRKTIDGLTYYKIEWQVTTEPEVNLESAESLVRKYWDNLRSPELVNRGEHEVDGEEI